MDYAKMTTEELQQICRDDAKRADGGMPLDELEPVLAELVRRRETEGTPFKSNEEAWGEFQTHYMPLTPSYHGKDCLGNGEHTGFECQCDECDYYLICFPEYEKPTCQ